MSDEAPTTAELQAEIARLRAVCEEFDVDPDWAPEPPRYWVVTAREKADDDTWVAAGGRISALTGITLKAWHHGLIDNLTRNNAFVGMLRQCP